MALLDLGKLHEEFSQLKEKVDAQLQKQKHLLKRFERLNTHIAELLKSKSSTKKERD